MLCEKLYTENIPNRIIDSKHRVKVNYKCVSSYLTRYSVAQPLASTGSVPPHHSSVSCRPQDSFREPCDGGKARVATVNLMRQLALRSTLQRQKIFLNSIDTQHCTQISQVSRAATNA